MNAEEKQALIHWIKPQVDDLQNSSDEIPFGLDEDSAMQLITMRLALAVLTAQPVKLPDLRQSVSAERYVWSDGVGNYKQDVAIAIRAAGYEVQE